MPYRIRVAPKKNTGALPLPVEGIHSWTEWARDRSGMLLGALLSLLVIGGGVVGYLYFRSDNAARASDAFSQASAFYEQANRSGANPEDQLRRALSRFSDLQRDFPKSLEAQMAVYYVGNTKFALGDFSGAVDAYRSFIARYPKDKMIQPFVRQRLALAFERLGDSDKALKALDELAKMADAPNRDQAYFEEGRLFEAKNQKVAAVGAYEELVKNFPESPLLAMAAERIQLLGGEKKEGASKPDSSKGSSSR